MLFENINESYMGIFEFSQRPVEDGFLKGNMFDSEYVPYKNLTYIKPKIKSQREKDLFDIMQESFKVNDYNLYLDLYPEDEIIFNKYKLACSTLNDLISSYEKKYGSLEINHSTSNDYDWINSPWPWNKEDSKYV